MPCLFVSERNLAPGTGSILVPSREQAFVQRAPQVCWALHQKQSKNAPPLGSGKGEPENNRRLRVSVTREIIFLSSSFVVPDGFAQASNQCDSIL